MPLCSQNYHAAISEGSFPRKRESRLDFFAWIPARALLGRDDGLRNCFAFIRNLEEK
jgi:hypothetical protein